jgi:hydrophobic/amphiphilic exporter-1 (mainly G- bacteria), HAE1 family
MLENITRHVEDGEEPLAAALKGSREIAFTIVSISTSLVAVLIPLLLMGGIIGRLFREFAVTMMMAIFVSAIVSLTLTPMMAGQFLTKPNGAHHGRLYTLTERGFEVLMKAYERGLDLALKFQFFTLLAFLTTLALSVCLFVIIPKGFFPQQDTGLITGISEAAQDVSFADMMQHQEALGEIVAKDPAIEHVAMSIGGAGNALNTGRMFISLKPRNQRTVNADQVIARLDPQLAKVEGARLFLQSAQDVRWGASLAYPVRVYDTEFGSRRVERMGAKGAGQDAGLARASRCRI